ncbi:energy-coupled thiamine transporter ThiT [Tissierella sp. Yu-01]|jgi:thiamine transporter|uniref:energy-coupled thiamine transporter ThiT n=1 Tax=Tissierella sp. Yu-01 TaxID=3035694 RepID=UPI00240E646D|nr:energy-coupled thiamine transporter ThiT [Tissierella sp. Yu-01]WFA09807.1 energy-coupled thiamine transporter ThiT [Tissierella sp. Yu-01]
MGKKFNVRMLAEGGMMLALAVLLNTIKIYQAPNGGSVSAGSMIPILLYAIRWGIGPGLVVGSVYGLLDFIFNPYFYHPLQFLLDYIFAYGILGIAGISYTNENKENSMTKIVIGIIIGIGGRMLSHVLSGVIFFAEYAGDQNPWIYSIIYNSTYLIPELIISVVVILLIWNPLKRVIRK